MAVARPTASCARGVAVMSHGEVVLERAAHELRGDRRLLAAGYLGEAAAASA